MERNDINIALTPLTRPTDFHYGTWDIEATDWWNLEIIGCFDGTNYYHFRSLQPFLDHIMQRKYKSWRWFAHFGGRYDMNFIFDHVRRNTNYKTSFYCSGSMVMKMTLKYGSHCQSSYEHCTYLCDSFRLLPSSLRSLAKAFNVDHQKGEIDFVNMTFGKEMIEYNEHDCRGLYEVLQSFFEQTGIKSETFASHALRYWRKEFLKEKIYPTHSNIADFVRKGYHGGRVEVFKRQADNLNAYDVNSMYPHVMRTPVPTRYIAQSSRLLDNPNHYGFVDALVEIPDLYIPPLPVRYEKLYFPVGKIRSVWSSEELLEAESRGAKILKVFRAYYFGVSDIFREFVNKLYQIKKTSGEPMRTIAKYLLNSLYGKFGQNPLKRVYVTETDAPRHAYPIVDSKGKPSGFAYYERTSRSAYLLPHIASAITSKARIVLYSRLDSKSFYCDTDSIFTTSEMQTGNGLGEWSQVGMGQATFIQPKLYKFNGTWKAKGLNREQNIDAFIQGEINTYLRRKSIKEAMRDGNPACMDVEIVKRLGQSRPKRLWIGEDTRPWNVMELVEESNLVW